ncbi:hypothetical protein FIBSPDRAFT_996442 [Athelia psychrophila]|uniref:Uncharacterized protein n=1 Tax=Athelia psychrophila TaxID=1759441 RepID=A0A165WY23_9AGAM|nr:hypothetical protein FIBSPDRAFT_996442 [Fibularhizoctonia sp. CBS 109695]
MMNQMMPLDDFPFGNFTPDGSKQLTPATVLVAQKGFVYFTAGLCALLGITLFFIFGRVPAPALYIQRAIDVAQLADLEHNASTLEGRAVATTVEQIADLGRDGNDAETQNRVLHGIGSSTVTFRFMRHSLLGELSSIASPPARLPPSFISVTSSIIGAAMCFASCSQISGDVVSGEEEVAIEHVQEGRIAPAWPLYTTGLSSFPSFAVPVSQPFFSCSSSKEPPRSHSSSRRHYPPSRRIFRLGDLALM